MKIILKPGEQLIITDIYNWTQTTITMSHSGVAIETTAHHAPKIHHVNMRTSHDKDKRWHFRVSEDSE